jgi:hypothetical protein
VAVGVGFADFGYASLFPDGAFRNDHQRVVAEIFLFVVREDFGYVVQVKRIFGNQAARGGDVGGVKGGEARVAAEDTEKGDAFVGAKGGALASD